MSLSLLSLASVISVPLGAESTVVTVYRTGYAEQRERLPERPKVGFASEITDAELVTLVVLQVLLGDTRELAGYATPS